MHGVFPETQFALNTDDTPVMKREQAPPPTRAGRVNRPGIDDQHRQPIHRPSGVAMLSRLTRGRLLRHLSDAAGGMPAGPRSAEVHSLDPTAIGRLTQLDPTGVNRLLQRVLTAFQGSVARVRPQLEAARRDADLPAIRMVTHTLKSSAASIGALALSQLCAEIETAIRVEPSPDLGARLDRLSVALADSLLAIDHVLKAHP
jgi:HPt (histidine-containing phosphotransfer) domain-containing protein